MTESNPVLYILMRNDLPSMNAGKAMAQASHASNAFVKHVSTLLPEFELGKLYPKWAGETLQGFGTVLVLSVNEREMRWAVSTAHLFGLVTDVIHDPTYPAHLDTEAVDIINRLSANDVMTQAIKAVDEMLEVEASSPWTAPCIPAGNKTVTFRLEDTCAYVFGDKNSPMLEVAVGQYPLHP